MICSENTFKGAERCVFKFLKIGPPHICLTVVWSTASQPAPHTPVSVERLSAWCRWTIISRYFAKVNLKERCYFSLLTQF